MQGTSIDTGDTETQTARINSHTKLSEVKFTPTDLDTQTTACQEFLSVRRKPLPGFKIQKPPLLFLLGSVLFHVDFLIFIYVWLQLHNEEFVSELMRK